MINRDNDKDAAVAQIHVTDLAHVAGQKVIISSSAPNVFNNTLVYNAAAAKAKTATNAFVKFITFGLSGDGSEKARVTTRLKIVSQVVLEGTFHLGGGAAGSFVDIDEDGNIHFSGLDDGTPEWSSQRFPQLSIMAALNSVRCGQQAWQRHQLNRLYNDDRGSCMCMPISETWA